jgi:aryl-alcohol dehydrogenase-like predicted oxidoreductase
MKFRAIANTDLLVSEVALDVARAPSDTPAVELALRLAYDEGINLFVISGSSAEGDAAFGAAFDGDRRSKVLLALRLGWTGDAATFAIHLDDRLRSLRTDKAEILLIDNLSADDLSGGAVGDAIHRLRAAGRVGHAGLRAAPGADDVKLIERNGFGLVEEELGPRPAEDRRLPALVVPPRLDMIPAASFLWQETGRTAAQAAIQFALAQPGVCSAIVRPSGHDFKELARAPMAPPLSPEELAAARRAFSEPVEA